MKRLTLAILLLLGIALPAQAQVTRTVLQTVFQNTAFTASGLGTQLLDLIVSMGALVDTNTWSGQNSFTKPVILAGPYSAAGTPLPTCGASIAGAIAYVSDATSPTYNGAYTSGGAVLTPVFCDGVGNWTTH